MTGALAFKSYMGFFASGKISSGVVEKPKKGRSCPRFARTTCHHPRPAEWLHGDGSEVKGHAFRVSPVSILTSNDPFSDILVIFDDGVGSINILSSLSSDEANMSNIILRIRP